MEPGTKSTLKVDLDHCVLGDDLFCLKKDWACVLARAKATCFQSTDWVEVWLNTFLPKLDVLRFYDGDVLVGMALLASQCERSKLRLPTKVLYLQQTGDQSKDQIWVEYNCCIAVEGMEELVNQAFCKSLKGINALLGWDELNLGTVRASTVALIEKELGLQAIIESESKAYGVDLEGLRSSGSDYISTLSKNSRYQIRRAIKLFENNGQAINVHRAKTLSEAKKFFSEAGAEHKRRWGETSGFYNRSFIDFHDSLIEHSFESGFIDVLRVSSGENLLGYLYNFCFRGTVYFYLSGLTEVENPKLKPGLVSHALAIEYYKARGMTFYDFMGGEGQYKQSLGTPHETLMYARIRKKTLPFLIEDKLRAFKQRLLS